MTTLVETASPEETMASQASRRTPVFSSTRSTPDAGTGALETRITVPPSARNRTSAAPASAYALRPLCMTPHTSQNTTS